MPDGEGGDSASNCLPSALVVVVTAERQKFAQFSARARRWRRRLTASRAARRRQRAVCRRCASLSRCVCAPAASRSARVLFKRRARSAHSTSALARRSVISSASAKRSAAMDRKASAVCSAAATRSDAAARSASAVAVAASASAVRRVTSCAFTRATSSVSSSFRRPQPCSQWSAATIKRMMPTSSNNVPLAAGASTFASATNSRPITVVNVASKVSTTETTSAAVTTLWARFLEVLSCGTTASAS
mmetsp:Transcript_98041/g.184326  ORF Transcript_98041/g.184326 Transcript_98041/m.184326 type:complete len:246 (+) Transcript_98041:1383-2120(+)